MISLRKIWMILFMFGTGIPFGYSQDPWEIIKSIESDNMESFQKKMEAIQDINMTLANGYTMLNYSILAGRIDIAEYLLSKNADVERISNKQSPLMLSARYNENILKLLISRGAEINREVNGKTALIAALEECNQNSIDILEREGATVEMRGGVDGPYIFYDTLRNITTLITVYENNEIQVDTLKNPPDEITVQTPSNGSFKVPLKKALPETKCIFKKADKIFAISDIEGNFNDFLMTLINNKIIDHEFSWAFGNGHLVLLGDFVDRGKNVTQVLWLIYKLEQEAVKAGGKVHYLLGNHEAMNLMEDYRFVDIRYKILAYKTGLEFRDYNSDQTEFGAWLRTKNVVEKIYLFMRESVIQSY